MPGKLPGRHQLPGGQRRFHPYGWRAALLLLVGVWLLGMLWVSSPRLLAAASREGEQEEATLLLQFRAETSAEERAQTIAQLGGEMIQWLPQIQVAAVRLLAPRPDAILQAQQVDNIRFTELDLPITGTFLPNDPALSSPEQGYAFVRIHALEGWEITTGSPEVVIAILDTGLNLQHPEFAGRIVPGYDFVNDDPDPTDDHGHGTHAAGLIAAAIDNGIGLAGVCPNCRLMPIKVLNGQNSGTWFNVARGILFAVDHGARVINLSLGSSVPSQTVAEAVRYAEERGVLVVAAAGNADSDAPFYPAALDPVIGVSATMENDQTWSLSNQGSYVDVAAPGHIIYSTYHDLNNRFGGYTFMSGTSMATPLVAGLAGLLLSQDLQRQPADLRFLITASADDLGEPGWDPIYGYGRINVARALSLTTSQPAGTLIPTVQLYLPLVVQN
ncbi:MAG: hypothetical protein KatS3mg050_3042 [Litorilinea sp.]|nr:MAG: hypothetical protein KatS3mg050_3042 [Litorilinea sp.]